MDLKRRFYREVATARAAGGYGVELDGRAVKTPGGAPLIVPPRLADAIAAEWAAQGDKIEPVSMPLMRLAATALDHVAPRKAETALATAAYAKSDLLCFWSDAPPELARRQAELWQPLLDWASLRFDAPLRTSFGLGAIAQPADSLEALERAVAALDTLTLTAIADLAQLTGSLIVALALGEGKIDAAAAAITALLEEITQAERWGEDEEAAQRREAIGAEIAAGERFLELLG
jgi:chaperone required for assembly of F1-ATPase